MSAMCIRSTTPQVAIKALMVIHKMYNNVKNMIILQ